MSSAAAGRFRAIRCIMALIASLTGAFEEAGAIAVGLGCPIPSIPPIPPEDGAFDLGCCAVAERAKNIAKIAAASTCFMESLLLKVIELQPELTIDRHMARSTHTAHREPRTANREPRT